MAWGTKGYQTDQWTDGSTAGYWQPSGTDNGPMWVPIAADKQYSQAQFDAIGYRPDPQNALGYDPNSGFNGGADNAYTPDYYKDLPAFLQSKGLEIRQGQGENGTELGFFNKATGQQVGPSNLYGDPEGPFQAAMLALAAGGGSLALGGAGAAGLGTDLTGATVGSGAVGDAGLTAAQLGSYAKQGYGLYNTGNNLAHGNYLGAGLGALGQYNGITGGSDLTNGLSTAGKAYGAINAASNGNYLGAAQGAYGAFNGLPNPAFQNSYTPESAPSGTKMDDFGSYYDNVDPNLLFGGSGLGYQYPPSIFDENGNYAPQPGFGDGLNLGNYFGAPAGGGGGGGGGGTNYGAMLAQLLGGGKPSSTSYGGVGAALAGLGAGLYANRGGTNVNTPNYQGAAQSMGQSARTDQSNPYGSLKYTQTGVDAQGNPTYKQDVSLNPQGQANLDSAQKAQGTALGSWNDVLQNAGGDWSKIPGVYGDAGSQAALVKQAQDAAYSQQTRYLDPQYQQQQQQLTSSLANQGVTMGSQAYTTAMDNFARQRDSAYGGARDSSISQGNALANQLFGQGLQAHNSGVNDWTTHLQGAGSAATTAGGNANSFNPTFAAPPGATNFLGASALQGAGNLNQYNATTGANNSASNGLFNLGGAVLSNPSWTDLIGSVFKPGGNGSANQQTGP